MAKLQVSSTKLFALLFCFLLIASYGAEKCKWRKLNYARRGAKHGRDSAGSVATARTNAIRRSTLTLELAIDRVLEWPAFATLTRKNADYRTHAVCLISYLIFHK
ncbi:hypothetical protein OROHE_006369 [Orobanche hederae]